METQKLSTLQSTILVMNTITPTSIIVIPIIAVGSAGQNAWMTILLSWLFGLLCVPLYCAINRHNPGQPFLEFLEQRLGRFVSFVVGLLLAQYYYATLAAVIREFTNFLSDEVMLTTPLFVLGAVTILVGLYAALQGIEVIARAGVIVFAFVMVFLVFGLSLESTLMDVHRLMPVGGTYWGKIVVGSLPASGWMSESAVLLLLLPFLKKPGEMGKIGFWGVTLSGLTLLATVLASLLILGPSLPAMLNYPTFAISELIEYGNFIERVDMAFICVWMAAIYMKVSIFFYFTLHCFTSTFRVRAKKPFGIGLALLTLLTSLYTWSSNVYLFEHQRYAMTPFLIVMNFLLPILLWIAIAATKGRKTKAKGEKADEGARQA